MFAPRLILVVVVAAVVAGAGCAGEPLEGRCEPVDGAVAVANEGWAHKNDPADHVYVENPPASGPHYPVWASYGVAEEPLERGQWVHNLEHGAIVLLLGDAASDEAEAELRAGFEAIPVDDECGHRRAILTRDPELDDPVAVLAADTVLVPGAFDNGVISRERIVAFAVACRNHAPENICQ